MRMNYERKGCQKMSSNWDEYCLLRYESGRRFYIF